MLLIHVHVTSPTVHHHQQMHVLCCLILRWYTVTYTLQYRRNLSFRWHLIMEQTSHKRISPLPIHSSQVTYSCLTCFKILIPIHQLPGAPAVEVPHSLKNQAHIDPTVRFSTESRATEGHGLFLGSTLSVVQTLAILLSSFTP